MADRSCETKSPAFAAVLIAAGFQPPAASAAEPLQPVGKWVVDYAETSCVAFRTYGSGDKKLTLAFRPSLKGTALVVLLLRAGKVAQSQQAPVNVMLGSRPLKTTLLRYGSEDKKSDLLRIAFDRTELNELGNVSQLGINARGMVNETFALPGIAAVLKALDTCSQDLRSYWNADEAGKARIQTPAAALKPLGQYFSPDDYPHLASSLNYSGSTGVTLMVDEKGDLKDCVLEDPSGVASLDTMTCQVLRQRARFRPATDAAGNPVRSALLSTRVTWRIQ